MSTLGARLRQVRQHFGLTQDQFGEICGVGKGAVSQWESDQTIPETNNLVALRKRHDFSMDWLLTGDGQMQSGLNPSQQKLLQVAQALPDYAVVRLTEEGHSYAELIDQAQAPAKGNGTAKAG